AGRWDAACGAGRRGQAPGPGRGGGTAPTFPASAARDRVRPLADFELHFSSVQPRPEAGVDRGGGQLRGRPAGLSWHVTSDSVSFSLLTFQD
uniref:Uncharacterized protein n=2 Tax=Canis lupus TaxID=9612 RepID=A0A8C0MZ06_CANLF